MITLAFFTFLVADPWIQLHRPEPYVGFGFSMNKQNVSKGDTSTGLETSRDSYYKTFASVSVPFKINEFEIFDLRTLRLMLNPEFILGVDYYGGSLLFGPEMMMPTNDLHVPNGYFWGLQIGPHLSTFSAQDVVGNQDTTALAINPYFGPYFNVRDWFALKVQVNPKFFVGRIARGGFRSEWSDLMGFALFFNLQAQF